MAFLSILRQASRSNSTIIVAIAVIFWATWAQIGIWLNLIECLGYIEQNYQLYFLYRFHLRQWVAKTQKYCYIFHMFRSSITLLTDLIFNYHLGHPFASSISLNNSLKYKESIWFSHV